jgi:WD40 repeat protein
VRRAKWIRTWLVTLSLVACARAGRADESSAPTYEKDIKPLLAKRCTVCHRASKRTSIDISGGLALDSLENILAGSARDKVLAPRKARQSELWRRLGDPDEDRRMPRGEEPLSSLQIELVGRWIDAGAPRGTPPAPAGTASLSQPRRVHFIRSLEISLPCDLKLPPGNPVAPKGGPLALSLAAGPLPPVTALAFRGDSRLLAVGTYGQVVLWDLHDGEPAGAITEIPGPVHSLAFSRDGRRLALGAGLPARSGVVRLYSVPDGTLIHDFPGHTDAVFAVAIRPDGAQLASASFDQTVRLWNLGLEAPDAIFRGHSDFVYSLGYTPDGRSLLSSARDRTIKRINTRTAKEERTYSEHNQEVLAVAAHPDGKRFVSSGGEPQIRWWSYDGEKSQSRRNGHSGSVHQLAFSGDGRWLISAGSDRTLRLWNGSTGEPVKQLPALEWQYAAAISDSGALAAGGGWDGLVRLWNTPSGRLSATLLQPPSLDATANGDPLTRIDWLAFTPGGHVAGSASLIELLAWRAGGVVLPAATARAACVDRGIVARAMHGEPTDSVKFKLPSQK